jgi:hypothetical protein
MENPLPMRAKLRRLHVLPMETRSSTDIDDPSRAIP